MRERQILANAGTNYGRLIVTVLATLILTPLIISRLGIEGFGIWSLALSIQAYFSLADLGLTFSATRYCSVS